jgi:hypothetical protein
MILLEKALVVHLRAEPSVEELVTTNGRARIHPLYVPQKQRDRDQMPCLVYSVVGETRGKTYCGTDRLVDVLVSLDSYAMEMSQARALSDAVRASLLDFRGLMGDLVRVRDVSFVSSIALVDMEPGLIRVNDTLSIWCEE